MLGAGQTLLSDTAGMYYLVTSLLLFLLAALASTPYPARFCQERFQKGQGGAVLLTGLYAGAFLLVVAYLIHDTYNPFLYFRF